MSLLALTPEELTARVVALGGRPFQARSIRRHVLARGVLDYDAMTDLPKALRARLAERLPVRPSTVVARHESDDGTCKLLVGLADGERSSAC